MDRHVREGQEKQLKILILQKEHWHPFPIPRSSPKLHCTNPRMTGESLARRTRWGMRRILPKFCLSHRRSLQRSCRPWHHEAASPLQHPLAFLHEIHFLSAKSKHTDYNKGFQIFVFAIGISLLNGSIFSGLQTNFQLQMLWIYSQSNLASGELLHISTWHLSRLIQDARKSLSWLYSCLTLWVTYCTSHKTKWLSFHPFSLTKMSNSFQGAGLPWCLWLETNGSPSKQASKQTEKIKQNNK